MRYLKLFSAFLLFASISSCCIKDKKCSVLSFQNLELVNFNADEATGDLVLTVYSGNTNFTQVKNVISLKGQATDNPNTFKVNTDELSILDDYQLKIEKTGKMYRINNFSVEKIACGKCILRNNNQFGYQLNGYTVNGKGYNYEGKVLTLK